MQKIIFRSGRELEVSFFGVSSYGILYIDCQLPIAEAFALFFDEENISDFSYIEIVEENGETKERRAEITEFNVFVGVEKLYNNIFGAENQVRITLRRSV